MKVTRDTFAAFNLQCNLDTAKRCEEFQGREGLYWQRRAARLVRSMERSVLANQLRDDLGGAHYNLLMTKAVRRGK